MDKYLKHIPLILFILMSITVGYLLYDRNNVTGISADFKRRVDSIERVNQTLTLYNLRDSVVIAQLKSKDSTLTAELEKQKGRIIIVDHWIDSSKGAVDKLPQDLLVHQLNRRYPVDTLANPVPIAKPVITETVKDLVELDGNRLKLTIKDSIIETQENKLNLKDSTITLLENTVKRDKVIIGNNEYIITEWKGQYDLVSTENKQLKKQTKFQKILNYILGGALVGLAVTK